MEWIIGLSVYLLLGIVFLLLHFARENGQLTAACVIASFVGLPMWPLIFLLEKNLKYLEGIVLWKSTKTNSKK